MPDVNGASYALGAVTSGVLASVVGPIVQKVISKRRGPLDAAQALQTMSFVQAQAAEKRAQDAEAVVDHLRTKFREAEDEVDKLLVKLRQVTRERDDSYLLLDQHHIPRPIGA